MKDSGCFDANNLDKLHKLQKSGIQAAVQVEIGRLLPVCIVLTRVLKAHDFPVADQKNGEKEDYPFRLGTGLKSE